MQKSRGFILAEIIISLLLVASIALLLVKQQWQNTQFVRQIQLRLEDFNKSVNKYELEKSGFALSEILISLLLVGILFSGLLQQYLQVYRQDIFLTKKIARHFDLQYLIALLRSSLRNAGFTPCANLNSLSTVDLQAFKQLPAGFAVTRMSENYKSFNVLNHTMTLPIAFRNNNSNKLLIADCLHAELLDFTVVKKGLKTVSIKLNSSPTFRYIAPIYIGELLNESFYLKGTDIYFKDYRASKLISGVQRFASIAAEDLVQVDISLQGLQMQSLLTRIRSK